MKHFQFSLLLFFCIATHVAGQRHKTIELTFLPTDFIVSERDGLLSIDSYRHAIHFDSDVSEPALPLVLIHVLIDSDEEYVNVDATYHDVPYSKGVQVRCNPTYVPRNMISQRLSHITPPEYSKNIYPSEFVRYTGTHHVDGYTYISFFVSPFFFLTQDKELLLHEKVVLDIKLKQEPTTKAKVGRAMRNAIKSIVINKDEMATLYPEPKRERTRTGLTANSDFDYLIITRDSLRDAFQKLADWKTRKGVPTRVVTIEQIDTIPAYWQEDFYGQIHTQLGIKRAIKDYYDNYNIKYVLLGGDNDIILAEMCHLQYKEQRPYWNWDAASDLFYACLNPLDWDKHHAPHEQSPAEYEDEIDMHPTLSVSRLSVCSNADALNQINKIIAYERGPAQNEWNDKYLSVGCALDPNYLYFGQTDVCRKGQLFKDSLESYGISDTFMLYDSLTSHPNNSHYDVTPTHFKEQLQNGYSFIQFDGHGGYDQYKFENPYYFYNQDAMDFTSPVYSMIVTSACYTNGFDQDCLGESFMRNPQGKIVAYWGGTLDVLGDTIEARLSAHLDKINIKLYKHLFEDDEKHLGDAVNAARLDFITVGNMPYDTPYRWNLLTLNLLGDPEMPIYTSTPQNLYYRDLYFENDSTLFVNFSAMGTCKVCIMSLDDNGSSYYLVEDQFFGNDDGLHLNLPSDKNYSICITKPNFRPYLLNLYRTGYVQNDTIANDAVVLSHNATIGRNVTPLKPNGPVVVEKGDMIIRAKGGVTILNSFEVKQGAALIIDPNFVELYDNPDE